MSEFNILRNPISTEKAIRIIETQNTLLFEVSMEATKPLIKKAIQDQFKVKVEKVNTYITRKGKKRAYIKLSKDSIATDIATNLGMI